MADARIVAELIVQGATKAVAEIASVTSATNQLVVVQESAGVRQRAVYDSISRSAQQAAIAAEDSAKRQADAAQRVAESSTRAATQIAAANATARRQAAAPVASTPVTASAFLQQRAVAQVSTAAGQQLVNTMRQQAQVADQVTQANTQKTKSIHDQSNAETKAKTSGISYLSTLSAIHAASFLASGSTFTLLGSFTTLGLAFSKLGPVGIAVGLAVGSLLGIFGAVSNAAQLLQQALLGTVQTLVTVAALAGAATGAAGIAGVKIAADVETQLAGLRAFGNATVEQLREASAQSTELALRFGVSAKEVLEGASLFARAGGTVKEAIDGATEAIVQLTVASQGEIQAAQAAIAVSQGIKAFNLEGKEAIRVANVLAGAAQASALSFTGVTQAFIQAAPGARTLGITIEDLGATMALLGNELVKGTITGTAFKQFLSDLINPSDKAEAELNKFGITAEEAGTGKIRPLIDVLGDLNKALGDQAVASGRVTEAERGRALAIIFEARASLAANVLTREGATGLEEFRDALEAVTATNIVNVLLLPLNKQLEILQVTVGEVGRAFGGPLLEPIRSATVGAINFFKSVIPLAELAGQVVSVVLTKQGFEALQTKITDLVGNNELSSFLIELVNSFRNVADVIGNQIVPAIVDFATRLGLVSSESGRMDQVAGTFEEINKSIQTTGAIIATLIRAFTELTVQIIHNEGRGKELRETFLNLTTAIVTQLVVGLVSTGVALTIALAILNRTGQTIREVVLPNIAALGNALITLSTIADKVVEILLAPFTAIARGAATAGALLRGADVEEALESGANAAKAFVPITVRVLQTEINAVQQLGKTLDALATKGATGFASIDELITRGTTGVTAESQAALVAAEANATALRRVSDEATQAFDELGTESAHTQAEAAAVASLAADAALERARVNARGFVGIFDNAGGAISDAFANVAADTEKLFNGIRDPRGNTTGTGGGLVDTKAIETAANRVRELARDMGRTLANLAEDTDTKISNMIEKGLERIGDIFEKADERLRELAEHAQDQINDIFKNIGQRRDDRQRTDDKKEELDQQLRDFQSNIDAEERVEERTLDRKRSLRQRDTEDNQRILDEQFSDLERVLQQSQDASERAFRATQRVREDALKTSQDAEERNLRRGLDATANARREQQQLAQAKTPEDRLRVQQQIQESRAQASFDAGQENQLLALRQRHEKQQRAASDTAELASIGFRRGLETQMLAFRKRNEETLRQTRRGIEDSERTVREREEDAQLIVRQGRAERLRIFREGQETQLRNFQDTLEDEAAQRQAGNIRDKAISDAQKIIANAVKQALEQETQIEQQLEEQRQALERSLRQQGQSIVDFEENLSEDVKAALQPQLNALKATLEREGKSLRDLATEQRDAGLARIGTTIGMGEIGLESLRPNLSIPSIGTQVIPNQVIQASVIQAAQLIIGQAAASQLAGALLGGLRQAGQEGVFDSSDNIDLSPVTGAINTGNNLLDTLRRSLGR